MIKVFVYSCHDFERSFLLNAASENLELVFTHQSLNEESANLSKGYNAIALFTSDDASAEVLKILSKNGVKFIALRSVGHDHVDLPVAKELGIKVANVPTYSPYSIAEHAVTLLLTLNRKILLGQQFIKQNNFCLDSLVGFDLYGKTIGIVGTGKIGTTFARIMHGFGCKLLGYDIVKNEILIQQTGITYVSLEDLCENSDIISIHCPLNEITKHLFDKKLFNRMKKGTFFINTARGGIVNTMDLIDSLENGTLAAAGLDVYENEKPIFFINHTGKPIQDPIFFKLQAFPNVIITGHQAFLTNEALKGIAHTTISNLTDYFQNGCSKNDLT